MRKSHRIVFLCSLLMPVGALVGLAAAEIIGFPVLSVVGGLALGGLTAYLLARSTDNDAAA